MSAIETRMIVATFMPKETHDLHPAVVNAVGKRLTWITQGLITTDRFAGQIAWVPIGVEDWPGWVPDEDLTDVERLGA